MAPEVQPPASPSSSVPEFSRWEVAVMFLFLLALTFGVPYLKPEDLSPMGIKLRRGHWTVEVTPVSPESAQVGQDVSFNARLVYTGDGPRPPAPRSILLRRNDSAEPVRVAFDTSAGTQKFTVRPQIAEHFELTGWDHYLTSEKPLKLHPKVVAIKAKPINEMQLIVQPSWSMARLEGDRWRLPVRIGLVDRKIYQTEKRIQFVESPESITIHLETQGGTLSKDELSIPKNGYRSDVELDFVTTVPRGNSTWISWSRPAIPYDAAKVPIACSTLYFDASLDPQEVPADGFTPSRLFVRLVNEEDGSLASLAPGGQAKVLLTHTMGSSIIAKPEALQFEPKEFGKYVDLASSAPGTNGVTLFTQPFSSRVQTLRVSYYFPWLAILLALAGSILGTAADLLYRRFTKRSRPSWKSILLRGALGTIATGIVWVGLQQGLSSVAILGIALSAPCSAQGSMFLGMLVGLSTFKVLGKLKGLGGAEGS